MTFSLNETLKTIKARRSIRLFKKQGVSNADIRILLEAANEAPFGYAATSAQGPQKEPLELKVKYLD